MRVIRAGVGNSAIDMKSKREKPITRRDPHEQKRFKIL